MTYDVIRGYGWSGKKDYRIQPVIKDIFNKRLEYRKSKNPLQELYKLIMNSCYGKCIQKPIERDVPYVEDIDVTNKRESYNKYKRIINEVMCLAYDIGCHIFYQDTDSMHIYTDDIEKLERAYYNKYGRELRGSSLGQFHSDFLCIAGNKETPWSIESIFLMKKLYIDKLTDSSGNTDYFVRAKGITHECIQSKVTEYGGLMNLYKALYNGEEVIFDLADSTPSFKFNKNYTATSNQHFYRKVSTSYEECVLNEYYTA